MIRREFIAGIGGAAAWPPLVRAQQKTKPTIGWLDLRIVKPPRDGVEGLRRGLAEVGFAEGRDVTVERYTTDDHPERLPALAADLVRRRPSAIVALGGRAAFGCQSGHPGLPIIFTAAAA